MSTSGKRGHTWKPSRTMWAKPARCALSAAVSSCGCHIHIQHKCADGMLSYRLLLLKCISLMIIMLYCTPHECGCNDLSYQNRIKVTSLFYRNRLSVVYKSASYMYYCSFDFMWLQLFDAALNANNKHAASWHGWGLLEKQQGHFKKARDLWLKVLSIHVTLNCF